MTGFTALRTKRLLTIIQSVGQDGREVFWAFDFQYPRSVNVDHEYEFARWLDEGPLCHHERMGTAVNMNVRGSMDGCRYSMADTLEAALRNLADYAAEDVPEQTGLPAATPELPR